MTDRPEIHEIHSVIDAQRAAAMHATLAMDGAAPVAGDDLPPFWHWAFFWFAEPPARLGRDGHPAPGVGLIPETGLPRRMWAGGNVEFRGPLPIGASAVRRSWVESVTEKTGRSGRLAFVEVVHEIDAGRGVAVRETQTLVFREDPRPGEAAPAQQKAPREEFGRDFRESSTSLFRYSALTFNGHRIHYDLEYAQGVEGYRGLIVHGPLLAQRLIDLARAALGARFRFSFRALAPVCLPEGYRACGRASGGGLDLWIAGEGGQLAMTACAEALPA